MLRKSRIAAVAVLMALAQLAWAEGKEKSVEVRVDGANKYSVEAFTMGGVELVGYLGDQKDEKGIEAVVWTGKNLPAEREPDLAKLAARAGVKAYMKEGGKLRPIEIKPPEVQ